MDVDQAKGNFGALQLRREAHGPGQVGGIWRQVAHFLRDGVAADGLHVRQRQHVAVRVPAHGHKVPGRLAVELEQGHGRHFQPVGAVLRGHDHPVPRGAVFLGEVASRIFGELARIDVHDRRVDQAGVVQD